MILGKQVKFPATLDEHLRQQLLECSEDLPTAVGDTMCADDFYEGNNFFVTSSKIICFPVPWLPDTFLLVVHLLVGRWNSKIK